MHISQKQLNHQKEDNSHIVADAQHMKTQFAQLIPNAE